VPAPPLNLAPNESVLGDPESGRIAHPTETPGSNLPPHQSGVRELEQTVPIISRAKKILETSQESEPAPPPTSIRRQSTPQKPSRIFSGKEDAKPAPEPEAPAQPRILSRTAPTLRRDKLSNSMLRRSEAIKFPVRDVIASASHEVSAREETRPSQPSVGSKAFILPEPRKRELLKRSGVQPIVPTMRSLPPIAPLPLAATTAPQTINVTIGRVEIRATSPAPPLQRARSKSATVLSLEDYLRQRAKGAA
jgi:hypothetical protein